MVSFRSTRPHPQNPIPSRAPPSALEPFHPLPGITHSTTTAAAITTVTTSPTLVCDYWHPDATASASTTDCAMGDSSVAGALVPSVPKPETAPSGDNSTAALALPEEAGTRAASASPQGPAEEEGPADRDLLCPICMAVIKDAFLTACGHSFCYMCVVTHLSNKSDCPCCGHYLTKAQLYPNFLLDKVGCLFYLPQLPF